MLEDVTRALEALEAEGDFATELSVDADDLHIEVKGVGPLRFPISAAAARRLCAVARQAPFGRRDQTLSDLSVRNTWEVPASRVKIDARAWNRALAPQLAELRQRLGLPAGGALKARLDKLLVYGPGQFFAPHQDSERDDDMVGSLVVQLPSASTGGSLVVQHQGRQRVFRGAPRGRKRLSLVAFYADCRHEVKPVKSGYRVVLTYHLHHQAPAAAAPAAHVAPLARAVQAYFAAPRQPDKLVYLLDHEYTQKSLSFDRLKSVDRLRVGALVAVAERLGCEVYLALADVHESWSCDEGDDWGYGRRRWFEEEEDDDDSEDHELGELLDSSVTLRHFVGRDGRPERGVAAQPAADELCQTRATADMAPFDSEYEGYMGNYGNTMDRWYHRAALVLWPRERAFVIRAKVSPLWAVRQVAASVKARRLDEARQRARALLPFWAQRVDNEAHAAFVPKLMEVLLALGDAELAQGLLAPLGLDRLAGAAEGLAALVAAFGSPWAQRLLAGPLRRPWHLRASWLPLLPGLCQALLRGGVRPGAELAAWLLDQAVARFVERQQADRGAARRSDDDSSEQRQEALALLESAAVLGAAAARDRLLAALVAPETGLSLTSAAALLRESREGRKPAAVRALGLGALHRHVVDGLTRIVAAPARARDDWSLAERLRCACALCRELSAFLRARDQVERAWPLAKDARQHIHNIIEGHDLPLSHVTTRQGRPFTLVLKKLPALFEREAARRKEARALLAWLQRAQAAFDAPARSRAAVPAERA